jgi:hypothetical protein
LRQLVETRGLAAAIYTQTTDVEIEVNGMMTYDRATDKMAADRVYALNNSRMKFSWIKCLARIRQSYSTDCTL